MRLMFLIVMLICLILNGCKKDNCDELCIEIVTLEEIFSIKYDCTYRLINNKDTLDIELINIEDLRSYGIGCELSTGGNAEVFFKGNINRNENIIPFNWPGCDGTIENNIDNPNLPSYFIDSFQIKMIKLYPLSENIDSLPISIRDYEIKLGILKI